MYKSTTIYLNDEQMRKFRLCKINLGYRAEDVLRVLDNEYLANPKKLKILKGGKNNRIAPVMDEELWKLLKTHALGERATLSGYVGAIINRYICKKTYKIKK